ncbi:MAG: hypothetical protein HC915_09125 [Anaerolineae bacterium]|nr:hypothetical protein [Anaerolineae bacterium]
MRLDDTITVFGYPDIGDTPIDVVRGTVSGFTAEARAGDRAWLRTNAPIPGGMTGGGAYNQAGRLIAIPTISPARVAGEAIDCRGVHDSNGDGQVDSRDICIPIGGFISALRPANLARGLVRAARLGITLAEDFAPAEFAPSSDPPSFSRLFTSTGVNAAGMPINVVGRVPAGTNSLYLFFDYRNLEDGMIYELRTSINGLNNPNFSLPPVTWSGGPRGLWYIGSSGIPWPNGVYEFTLFIEGRQVASHQITVGGAPEPTPRFSDISFGLENLQGGVEGTNFILPETNIVRARFNFRDMQNDLPWLQRWFYGDQIIAEIPGTWPEGTQGVSTAAAISSEVGLLAGRYRLELYIGETLAATSDFVVAGGAEAAQAQIFDSFVFAAGEIARQPQPPIGQEFVGGLQRLYVFFNWRQLSQATPWTWRWLVDGDVMFEVNTFWASAPTGERYFLALEGRPNLPDATYTFEIELGGIVVESVEARVGLGQLPLGVFASAEGVQLTGRILDAATGDGIPGAIMILLLPEFSVEDFTWDAQQILDVALADERGFYQLPSLLARGTEDEPLLYSLLVRAEGYLPMQADGIPVTPSTQSPLTLNVELNQD